MKVHPSILNLLACGLGIIIALSVAEGVTRIFALAPALKSRYFPNYVADPVLPFIPQPLSVHAGQTEEFVYEYRHNHLGFRDVEHPALKEPHVVRILGIGDSFTYGIGVQFEATYLSQLETMLNNQPGDALKIEVIKAGIPRYFPKPERLLLEKFGGIFQPDLILVGFVPNDVIDTYEGMESVVVDPSGFLKTREAQKLGTVGVALYIHSHFFRLFLQKYIDFRIAQTYQPHWEDVYKADGYHENDWTTLETEYAIMAGIAQQLKADMIIVHIPQQGPWDERHFYPSKRLAAWCAQQNVGFIDPLPAMIRAAKTEVLYYEKDGHCTPSGYNVIAKEVFTYLIHQRNILSDAEKNL